MIDVRDGRLLPDQTVVIVGRHIRTLGPVRTVRVPPDARLIDARGRYLIPGLWEMHVHLRCYWDVAFPLFIATGVTGIRDPMFGYLDSLLRFRREIASGTRVGPRAVVTGGSLGPESSAPDEGCGPVSHRQVAVHTPAEARRAVDSLKAAGVDFVKTRFEGRTVDDRPWSELLAERDIYVAIADEARRIGVPFEGHMLWGVMTLADASDYGQRIIDHDFGVGYCYEPPDLSDSVKRRRQLYYQDSVSVATCRRVARRLRQNGTWLVPTLGTGAYLYHRQYMPTAGPAPVDAERRDSEPDYIPGQGLRLAQLADLPILAGTDQEPWGFSLHAELALFVREGLTPLQALQTATLNPAKYLNGTDSLGTVTPGKLADLVLLDANPLEDIHNTSKIRAVVANGRYFDRAALDSLLAQAERRAQHH